MAFPRPQGNRPSPRLPHDGVATNNITGKRYIDHWTEAGFASTAKVKIKTAFSGGDVKPNSIVSLLLAQPPAG
jgi:hypothetical protein